MAPSTNFATTCAYIIVTIFPSAECLPIPRADAVAKAATQISGKVLPPCSDCFGYITMGDERQTFMEEQFAQFNPQQTVRAVTPVQMKPADFDGTIVAAHNNGPAYEDRVFGHKYSKSELSEILTAKLFFSNASSRGLPYAVLLEDDIVLTNDWVEHIQKEVALAPADWEVLQFFTNSLPVRFSLANVCEPFVRWMPEYWGAAINVVSPAGMAKIAARQITVKESPVVIDYWLYAGVNTYTHTRNWFGERMFKNRMQHATFEQRPGFPAPVPCEGPSQQMPPIAAFTVTKQNELSISTLMNDAPASLEAWIFTVDDTKPPALTSPKMHTAVCLTGSARWVSKWSCLARHGGALLDSRFHFVFAFDDDLRFNAFPWKTLWSRIAQAPPMIVGFPRESDWGNKENDFTGRYEGELMSRDFFITQNGDFWRNRTCGKGDGRDKGAWGEQCDARWEGQHAPTKQHLLMPMKYIETGSNFISASFLKWYLGETKDFIEYMDRSGVDWGFDHMWCGGATSYMSTLQSDSGHNWQRSHACAMVPLPVWHADSASLTGHYTTTGNSGGRSYKETGIEQLQWIQKHSSKFAGWLEHSEWQRTMLGKANVWEFRDDVSVEQIVKISSRAEMDALRKPPPMQHKEQHAPVTPTKPSPVDKASTQELHTHAPVHNTGHAPSNHAHLHRHRHRSMRHRTL